MSKNTSKKRISQSVLDARKATWEIYKRALPEDKLAMELAVTDPDEMTRLVAAYALTQWGNEVGHSELKRIARSEDALHAHLARNIMSNFNKKRF